MYFLDLKAMEYSKNLPENIKIKMLTIEYLSVMVFKQDYINVDLIFFCKHKI